MALNQTEIISAALRNLSALAVLLLIGCGGQQTPESVGRSEPAANDPPLRTAPAQDKKTQITRSELQTKLQEKNPDYQGDGQIHERDGEIILVDLKRTRIADISPLAGLPVRGLDLFDTDVSDISPLQGMPLEHLMLEMTEVTDISPLQGMPLKQLWLNRTKVENLSALKGMGIQQLNLYGSRVSDIGVISTLPLNTLWLRETPVTDFTPLKGLYLESLDAQDTSFSDLSLLEGMPLQRLNIAGCEVTDLTPLKEFQLTRLIFTPGRITKGMEVIRAMSSLRELDVEFREPKRLTPQEFWEKYDAGELTGAAE